MSEIRDEHVEWAIVNRLKAMLDDPPETDFNVSQSFALFSAVLLWIKQRAWVDDATKFPREMWGPTDFAAHSVREQLQKERIVEAPWHLSRRPPTFMQIVGTAADGVNAEFEEKTAEDFFKWLRDALAHGDGRTVTPIHQPSRRGGPEVLIGFRFVFKEERHAQRKLTCFLFEGDMRRMGAGLADRFCQSLSGGDRYFEEEAGTAKIKEHAA